MKITELRAKSAEELKDLVLSSKKEQFNLRMQRATGALANTNRFAEIRKTVARAKTLLNEKKSAPTAKAAPAKKATKKKVK